MPSFVLNFSLAESLELAKNYTEVRSIFDRLLQGIQKELEEIEAKIAASSQHFSFSDNTVPMENQGDDSMQVDHAGTNGLSKEACFATQKTTSSQSSPEERELRDRKREYGLVWIMYIRFAMRSEGVDASRKIFSVARKDKFSPWEVFEAAGGGRSGNSVHVQPWIHYCFHRLWHSGRPELWYPPLHGSCRTPRT